MRYYPLVLICGKSGVGKNTLAEFIRNQRKEKYNVHIVSFSDPLKRILLELSDENKDLHISRLWGDSSLRSEPWSLDKKIISWNYIFSYLRTIAPLITDLSDESEKLHYFNNLKNCKTYREGLINLSNLFENIYKIQNTSYTYRQYINNVCIHTCNHLINNFNKSYSSHLGITDGISIKPNFCIISDGRLPSEVISVRKENGFSILLKQEENEHDSFQQLDSVPEWWYDAVVYNPKSDTKNLDRLEAASMHILKAIETPPMPISRW